MSPPTRIVIIGGGYVAVWAHRAIHRRLRFRMARGQITTTVIAPGLTHRFHGFTGEVLGGILPRHRVVTPLSRLCPGATLIDGTVTAVELDAGQVSVTGGPHKGAETVLPFDQLIFAAGSADSRSLPGLAEFGYSTKDPAGFEALLDRLDRPWRELVVVGGGLAGVELCAAIAERFRGPGAHAGEAPRIHLVHSGNDLVGEFGPRYRGLTRYVQRQLERYGVRVHTATAVTKVGPTGVDLADGTSVATDLVVSTAGQRPVILPGTERLARRPDGRLRVDGCLRVVGHQGLWAGGDLAAVPRVLSGEPSPANALWAIKHGVRLGRNVVRAIGGRRPRRFRYPGLGRAASLGIGRGAAHLYGVPFTGWPAWLTRAVFFLVYMPSRRYAWAALRELSIAVRRRGRAAQSKSASERVVAS